MNAREANGLALVRTMLHAAGRDLETPWLLWTGACEGLMATWPTLPRHPRDVERIADGCANHSLDAVRYGVQWYRSKVTIGIRSGPHPLMWKKQTLVLRISQMVIFIVVLQPCEADC